MVDVVARTMFSPERDAAVAMGIADAQVSITLNDGWDEIGLTPAVITLAQEARRARGFGDFWQHMLVAEGAVDVAAGIRAARQDVVVGAPHGQRCPRLDRRHRVGDRHGHVVRHVDEPGRGAGFSLEGPEGVRFIIRSRVFSDEEAAALEAAGPPRRGGS